MKTIVVIPTVGMGATLVVGSDRYPLTVVRVVGPKTIEVQADKAVRLDKNGQSENQDYHYIPNPKGETKRATLRKGGYWQTSGSSGSLVHLGEREMYQDPSF